MTSTNGALAAPTLDSLLAILFQATSSNPRAIAQATDVLANLEQHPVFWVLLLKISFERNNPLSLANLQQDGHSSPDEADLARRWNAIRTISIIRFKNGIDKYWRSRVVNRVTITIPQETKVELRSALMRCLDEPEKSIALQASVAIAKIARHDFPTSWPHLFDELQNTMRQAHAQITQSSQHSEKARVVLLRSVDVCTKTLKELSTVRILAGKIRMTELAQQLLPTLVPMHDQYFHETITKAVPNTYALQQWFDSSLLDVRIRTCHLLLKSVTHLAVADAGTISRNNTAEGGQRSNYAQELFRSTPHMLQSLRDVRWAFICHVKQIHAQQDLDRAQDVLRALQKHMLAFGKLYTALASRDRSKAVTWQGWDEVVMWYWQQAKEATADELADTSKIEGGSKQILTQRHPTKLVVQALTLFQQSLQEWKSTNSLPNIFKDEQTIASIVDVLMGKLMLLTEQDLTMWQADPEEWSVAEEAETYNMEVRPAAERVLMSLAIVAPSRQSKFVGEYIWQKLQSGTGSSDTDMQAVLHKDALYTALGRCREQLPFSDEVMSSVVAERLLQEASLVYSSSPLWLIIRRRIAWLIWEWSEHIIPAHRQTVYSLLVSLLESVPGKTDAAVQLAAARSLAALADALEFDSDAFQPFIDVSLSRLAQLAAGGDLQEMDSIKTCTNALSILIERLGARIAPHLQQLAQIVPHLWTLDDREGKARPSVIVFVSKLVRSVELIPDGSQGSSTSLHGIVEVVVRDSLAPDNSSLLGKDALELWIRTLRSSSHVSDPLFRLLPLLPGLLDQPDFCPEACRVAQESVLMSAEAVLSKFGGALFEGLAQIVGDPLSPLIMHPLSVLDVIVQASSAQSIDSVSWAGLFDQTGLFCVLLGSLLNVKDSSIVRGNFVALLSRMAFTLHGTSLFMDLVRSAAVRLHGPNCDVVRSVLIPMVKLWCECFEQMASMRKRKAVCLGLAALIDDPMFTQYSESRELLSQMVGVWMDLLGEIRPEALDDRFGAPALPSAPPSSPVMTRSLSQPSDVTTAAAAASTLTAASRRSPSPTLSIPGLEGIDDADDWLEETSPGRARMTELARVDRVQRIALPTFIHSCIERATQQSPQFRQAFQQLDPLVLDLLQKDLGLTS